MLTASRTDLRWWDRHRHVHTSLRPQQAWTAPAMQSSSTRPEGMGANAESFALIACANSRGLAPDRLPTLCHRRWAVRDQRTNDGQPVAASPTIANALKADLTAPAGSPPCDHCASAAAITLNVYRHRRATSAGTTKTTESQARQTYRRASISVIVDRPPTCTMTIRTRRPWPCRTRHAPTGRLAAPQPGQRAGRATETDGGPVSNHCLTSTRDRTIRSSLRPCKMCGAPTGTRRLATGGPRQPLTGRHYADAQSSGRAS